MKDFSIGRVSMLLAIAAVLALPAIRTASGAQIPPIRATGQKRMPEPPTPAVISLETFGLVVADLDAAVKFYRDGIGLELIVPPTTRAVNVEHNSVVGTAGARRRYAVLKIPNEPYSVTLDEYTGLAQTRTLAEHNDPGSSFLNYGVWNGEESYARLKKFNPTLLGRKPRPYPTTVPAGRMTALWLRDPDGHLIEYMQGGWDAERKPLLGVKSVYRSHFGMTMTNYQDALTFYHDMLGFDISSGFYPTNAAGEFINAGQGMEDGLGVPAAANYTGVAGHCAFARCEMFEFRDAPRKPFHPNIQDPGAAYLSMWVSDLDDLIAKARLHKLEFITAGGMPVTVKSEQVNLVRGTGHASPPTVVTSSRQIMIRDPAGFPILLMQAVN